MTASRREAGTGLAGPRSTRARLARIAWETALATQGIGGGSAGPTRQWATADGDEVLYGVVATARADGSFDVQLHLVARWPVPPLHELADRIRDRVRRAAAKEKLADSLSELSVFFADVVEPESGAEP